jgi:preprotein translocase subunit SecE
MNAFKWLIIVVIIAAGVVANLYYSQVDVAYRAAIGIGVAVVVLGIAYTTTQGATAWAFVRSARTEMRKVVWPTRQETIQTALVVVAMVVVTALILWGIDTLFMWIVGMITGQRG